MPATAEGSSAGGDRGSLRPSARARTVWIGKTTVKEPRERAGPGRRKVDRHQVPEQVWSAAHTAAKAEGVSTGDVVVRAVRAHLKKKR